MRVVTLSGWGQPYDALKVLAPDAIHINYAKHANVQDALADITAQSNNSDLVIGWSLGGQLAVRAIAEGMFRPKKLVLIATPFQFVAQPENPLGMGRETYTKFRNNYAKNPVRTLDKAWELIHKDDENADQIRAHMDTHDKNAVLQKDWLHWLDKLDGFNFDEHHLSDFPPTLLLHGEKDLVVDKEQSERFVQTIPHAKHITFASAGHAPHWHDAEAVKKHIKNFVND